MLPRLSGMGNWDTIKKYFYLLVVISILGALGPILLSKGVQKNSQLFTLSSFTLYSHSLGINDSPKQKYALLENGEDNDFSVKDSQTFSRLLVVAIGLLILPSINLQWWETFFGEIKSFFYISFFSSLPLRSPPLFS